MPKPATAQDTAKGCLIFFVVIFAFFGWLLSGESPVPTETPAEMAARRAEEAAKKAEERLYAQNCLSPWDGSHRAFESMVTATLNDPDSYEHVETLTWPRRADGRNEIVITFRAKNGFGGTITAKATGTINADNCSDARLDDVIQ